MRFINRILDKGATIKTMKKRENKIISKPWITRGIKIFMKKTNKQIIKAKSKQQN